MKSPLRLVGETPKPNAMALWDEARTASFLMLADVLNSMDALAEQIAATKGLHPLPVGVRTELETFHRALIASSNRISAISEREK